MKTENEVYDLSKAFALRIIKLSRYLTNERHEYALSKQVLKAGTSIGANISEALMGQSRSDFLAKCISRSKSATKRNIGLNCCFRQVICRRRHIRAFTQIAVRFCVCLSPL